ncbi:RHS repeat-associated core domain-containing protein [Marinobacter sp. MBR-99]|uniref:RHS repeat domain-containing protein n=1 Tax=Marinobacter sp. MBR-99 TaxID=3156461 RepID=UPI00339B2C48
MNRAWQLYQGSSGLSRISSVQQAVDAECKPYFMDIHGDRLTDLVFECGSAGQLFISNGSEWVSVNNDISGLGSVLNTGKGGAQIGDIDGSGKQKLLVPPINDGGNWQAVTVWNDGDYTLSDTGLPHTLKVTDIEPPDSPYTDFINIILDGIDRRNQAVQFGDFTGNGVPDAVQANAATNRWDLYSSSRDRFYGIQSLRNHLGYQTSIIRSTLAQPDIYDPVKPDHPEFREAPLNLSVVERVEGSDGRGGERTTAYLYKGARVHYKDLGFTGFESISQTDSATELSELTEYEQDHADIAWVLNGRPKRTEMHWNLGGHAGPVQISNIDWVVTQTSAGTEFPNKEREVTAELDGNYAVAHVTEKQYQIDVASGTYNKTTTKVGSGTIVQGHPSIAQVQHQRIVEKAEISTDLSSWLLGFVGSLRETSTAFNSSGIDETVRETRFTQWPGTLDVHTKTAFPGDPTLTYTERVQYDAAGNRTSRRLEGNVNFTAREWTYNDFIHGLYPQLVTAPLNSGSSGIEYDLRFGEPIKEIGPNGLSTHYRFDAFGRHVTTVSALGVVTDYEYALCKSSCTLPGQSDHEASYRVTKRVTHPDGTGLGSPTRTEFFDQLGRRIGTSELGSDGQPVYQIWKYDSAGRLVFESRPYRGTEPDAYTTHSNFDYAGRAQESVLHNRVDGVIKREQRTYSYRNPGVETSLSLLTVSEGGGDESWESLTTSVTDSRGKIVSIEEAVGTPQSIVTEYEHNALGAVSWVQVNSDYRTTLTREYDAGGNLIRENDPDAGSKFYEYDALGNLIATVDANGNLIGWAYDTLDRQIMRTDTDSDGNEEISEWFYDLSTECEASGKFVGALCLTRQSSGFEESYSYDALGNLETTVTFLPNTTFNSGLSFARVHDEFGREVARSYPNGFSAFFSYNAFGYLDTIDNDNGETLKEVLTRDAEGNELSYTLGNGVEVHKTYSKALGTLASVSASGIQQEEYTWFGNGSLYKRARNGISVTYSYDPLNRLSMVSGLDSDSGDVIHEAYTYDALGNVLSKPGVVEAAYYDTERPHAVREVKLGQHSFSPEPTPIAVYAPAIPCQEGGEIVGGRCHVDPGEIEAVNHNFVSQMMCSIFTHEYDGKCYERVSFVCSKYQSVSTGIYSRSRCGAIYSIPLMSFVPAPNCPVDLPTRLESFNMYSGTTVQCFDTTDRYVVCPSGSFQAPDKRKGTCYKSPPVQDAVLSEKCVASGESHGSLHDPNTAVHNGSCWYIVKDIDPVCPAGYQWSEGINPTSEWQDAKACYKEELVNSEPDHPDIDQIITYQYDENGNVVRRGDETIAYNTINKPLVIRGPSGETQFRYGPDRSRYSQASAARNAVYVGGGQYEVVQEGSRTREIAYVGDFLQVVNEGSGHTYEYLHRDHLGSIIAMSDATGSPLGSIAYEPFGKRSGDIGLNHRGFTDHEHLAGSELIHMNGRLYDAVIGRFTTPDIVVQNVYGSQNYNRYSYVLNNPLSFTDPTGYCSYSLAEGGDCLGYALDLREFHIVESDRAWAEGRYADSFFSGLKAGFWTTVGVPVGFINQGIVEVGNSSYRATLALVDHNYSQVGREAVNLGMAFTAAKLVGGSNWQGSSVNVHFTPNIPANSGAMVDDVLRAGEFTYTRTAGNHINDIVSRGAFKGELSRPYMNSPLTIREIMSSGKGVPDPGGLPGALRYDVPGQFRKSQGNWELVVDPKNNTIYHFLFGH